MTTQPTVSIHRLILSLSKAADGVAAQLADRQRRAACIAVSIARRMALPDEQVRDLFLAGCLHDIGLIRPANRLRATRRDGLAELGWHCQAGYDLLRDTDMLAGAAEIVRDHDVHWSFGAGQTEAGRPVAFGAHVLCLADAVERGIDRDGPVLAQAGAIIDQVTALADARFHPDCVDAFRSVAEVDAFWLDCVGPGLDEVLLDAVPGPVLPIDDMPPRQVATIFARSADAMSVWTATHSAGVAAAAGEIAGLMKLSPGERKVIHLAGWLHDVGKLAAPEDVRDDPGELSQRQWASVRTHPHHTRRILRDAGLPSNVAAWASLHHERPDGQGYPYRLKARDLPLAARVVAVADVFSALTEDRAHRARLTPAAAQRALEEMASSGRLDGDVVRAATARYEQVDRARQRDLVRYSRAQKHLAATAQYPVAA